jgi:hypothetical protein
MDCGLPDEMHPHVRPIRGEGIAFAAADVVRGVAVEERDTVILHLVFHEQIAQAFARGLRPSLCKG